MKHLPASIGKTAAATATLLACLAQLRAEDPIAPTLGLTAPADSRVVLGTASLLSFGLQNNEAADSAFDLSVSTGNGAFHSLTSGSATTPAPASPWLGASLAAGQAGTLIVAPDLSGVLAGQGATVSIAANRVDWAVPATASTNIQVVANRVLTGSATIDAGRHMVGATIGTLTLDGGALADHEATRVTANAGGHAQYANGLRLGSASGFTFDGAGQTHELAVSYTRGTGAYTINQTLPGASATGYTDASGVARADFGGTWSVSANYGNLLGETRDFQPADADTGYSFHPGTGALFSRDYADTAQLSPRNAIKLVNSPVTWELGRGAGVTVNERQNALLTGESIPGSNLDLSAVSVNITGTALANRTLYGVTDLGRHLVDTADVAEIRSETLSVTTSGSDDHVTRLRLDAFAASNSSLSASLAAPADFTSASSTAAVQVSADFLRTHATPGVHQITVNAGAHISTLENGGAGLSGETVQSSLPIGYQWTVVQNNTLRSDDFLIIDWAGTGPQSYVNYSVARELDTDVGTDIGVDRDVSANASAFGAGLHNLGTTLLNAANGRVQAEGLAGEAVIAQTSFNTRLAVVAQAARTVVPSVAGDLTDGGTITITDTGAGAYQASTVITKLGLSGNEKNLYNFAQDGGNTLAHGASTVFTVDYIGDTALPSAGQLGRVARATFELELGGEIDEASIYGLASGDRYLSHQRYGSSQRTQHSYNIVTRFDAPASATGSAPVAAGTDFGQTGLALTNAEDNKSARFAAATDFQVRDSSTLADALTVAVTFQSLDTAAPARVDAVENAGSNQFSQAGIAGTGSLEFASDIVSVTGLDGVLHVIQITFDPADIGGTPQVVWETSFDAGDGAQVAWVNAILGNSDITDLDLANGTLTAGGLSQTISAYLDTNFVFGTYESYLGDKLAPELGKWGYSLETGEAWAVIDHNSSFAVVTAVPEPSSYALLLGSLAAAWTAGRRRRQ